MDREYQNLLDSRIFCVKYSLLDPVEDSDPSSQVVK